MIVINRSSYMLITPFVLIKSRLCLELQQHLCHVGTCSWICARSTSTGTLHSEAQCLHAKPKPQNLACRGLIHKTVSPEALKPERPSALY